MKFEWIKRRNAVGFHLGYLTVEAGWYKGEEWKLLTVILFERNTIGNQQIRQVGIRDGQFSSVIH